MYKGKRYGKNETIGILPMITRWMRVRTDHNKPRKKWWNLPVLFREIWCSIYYISSVCVLRFCYVLLRWHSVSLSCEWSRMRARTHPRSINSNNQAMWLLVCCGAPCELNSFTPITVFSDIKFRIAGGAYEYNIWFNLMLMMMLMNSELRIRIILAAISWESKCQPQASFSCPF